MTAFTQHSQVVQPAGIISPRPVTVPVRALSFDPKDRASIDAFADEMLRQQRQHNLSADAEQQSEGRVWPSRISRHDD